MSFEKKLKHYIYQRGRVTYDEIEVFARREGHKVSYAERILRRSPKIEPVKNEKGFVVGYTFLGNKTPIRADLRQILNKKTLDLKKLKEIKQKQEANKKITLDDNGRLIVKF